MARELSNSGIEWIGDIPKSWKLLKGKYLFRLRNEKGNSIELQLLSPTQKYGVIPQQMYEELSGMTAVKLDDNADLSTLKSIYEGDFCISLRSFQGGFEYSNYNGVVSPAYQVFYKTADLCDTYYRYMFKDRGFIEKMTSYTKTFRDGKSISFADFGNSLIPVPSLEEQERIATFLDTECGRIDAVIEQTQASIDEYKKLKQSVITQAVTKGIRPDRQMKDSGNEWIGDIPDDWTTPKMGAICPIITDYVASGSFASLAENVEYLDEPDYAMLIRTADVSNKGYNQKPVYINKHAYEFLHNSNLFGGELMFPNIGASVGDVYIVPILYERMSLAPNAIMVKTNHVDKYYYYYFQSKPGRLTIEDIAQSTAQAKFNKTDFRQLRVLLPSDQEQQEIVEYLDKKIGDIEVLIKKKEQLVSEIELYKRAVVFEYITGKKEVV